MSILIKGMDMPKDCEDCRFGFYREGDSAPVCYLTKHIIIRKKAEERHNDCPLVEIPTPHGRLIDENDVKAKCVNEVFDRMGTIAITESFFDDEWADDICDVPTVIESEE